MKTESLANALRCIAVLVISVTVLLLVIRVNELERQLRFQESWLRDLSTTVTELKEKP